MKPFSLALLAVGVALIVMGFAASDSAGSAVSRVFTGAPTDKTVWLMVGGVLAVALGLGGLWRGSRSP